VKRTFVLFCAIFAYACGADSPTAPSAPPTPTPGPPIPAANRVLIDPVLASMSVDSFSRVVHDLTAIPSRHVTDPGSIQARDALVRDLTLPGWQVSLGAFSAGGTTAYNVIADWPGLDPQVVIVSAHYDSVGAPNAGGNDDAAGCAAIVTIAEALARTPVRFRHGVRLVAFSAEELGLLGSAEYVRGLAPESALANLNLDGIAPLRTLSYSMLVSVDPPESQWLIEYTRRVVAIHSTATGIREVVVYANTRWGTDTQSFWRRGISGIWILGNGDDPYANRPQDTIDNVDVAYGTRVGKVAAAVALNLAEPTAPE
jgi:hypothetical protein